MTGLHWDSLIEPFIDFTSTVMAEVLAAFQCFHWLDVFQPSAHHFVPSNC